MDAASNQLSGVGLPQVPSDGKDGAGIVVGSDAPVSQQAQPAPQPTVDVTGGDTEAIDQDWVNKAKSIVEKTKADPFAQSNELSKIKAGYLKARFDKDINTTDRP